ncbi:NADP-dependent oxidoreductase domain-containing protein [Pyronema omphalodes]|nr:NADP-dependent oxidoreductase domain-containing protein [Pyronema omphalodes]
MSSKLTFTSRLPVAHAHPPTTRPHIGFGVYLSPADVCKASCLTALKHGYRAIDTAQYYENEAQVGEAVRESGIPREEIFITTKIMTPEGSVEKSYQKCLKSVEEIGLGYVDLFLIHTPSSGPEGRKEMWQALERLLKEGKTKAIGVSNYGVAHMEEIKTFSDVMPAANQIELHVQCQQRPITEYCTANGINVEAYCPIARGKYLDDPTLKKIADAHNVTVAQVLIRWILQMGFIPYPKSDHPERIKQNADLYGFELSEEEMRILGMMDKGHDGAVVPQKTECP